MTESANLIQHVRDRLTVERKIVSELNATMKNDSMKQLLKRASTSLDDIENIFLRSAEKERRTPEALKKWLSYTDLVFEIAAQQRKVVEKALESFGPDAVAIQPR
jgi:hypothetical protein